ncbi:MAG: hypothetical protein Q8904_00355 [Bacteroidota bacterium]|nr:hypothetical protein [Bacteroidota bacterium]
MTLALFLSKKSKAVSYYSFSVPGKTVYSFKLSKSLIICLLLLVGSVEKTFAIDYYQRQSGNWNNPGTWTTDTNYPYTANTGTYPQVGDNAHLANNGITATITLNSDAQCTNLIFDNSCTESVIAMGDYNLTVSGSWKSDEGNKGKITQGTGYLQINGGVGINNLEFKIAKTINNLRVGSSAFTLVKYYPTSILTVVSNYDYNCFESSIPSGIDASTASKSNSSKTCSPSLMTTALTSFGPVCTGTTAGPNSFTISALALTSDNVTVAALNGFSYSTTAEGPYTSTLSLPHPSGHYSQVIYVRFIPTSTAAYDGSIIVSGGGASAVNVAAVGSGAGSVAPTVTTPTAVNVNSYSATLGGNITIDGCSSQSITERGIYYSTTNGFDIGSATKVSETGTFGTGSFTENITGLSPAIYYYKAFATNSNGTGYSTQGTLNNIPKDLYYVTGGGSWSTIENWKVGSSTGAAATALPTAIDNVYFTTTNWGGTVTADITANCRNLTIDRNVELKLNGNILNVYGNAVVASSDHGILTVGTGTLNINGDLTFNGGNCASLTWATGSIFVGGNLNITLNCGPFTPGTGLFTFNGSTATINSDITIPNFKQSVTGFTKAGSGALTISTKFDRDCGPAPTVSAGAFTVTGSTINASCSTPTITGTPISGSPFCAGSAVSVPYAISGTYASGNVFTAQLSSSTGSFASPVTIGTVSSTTSGTISAVIPTETAPGSGYRIRVVSNTPVITGKDNGSNLTVNPNNTIALSSVAGTDAQIVCINTSITNITYKTTGATGASVTGLPAGVTGNWKGNVVTISGTPTVSGPFTYTVTLTGGCNTVKAIGTVTVNPNLPVSLLITPSANPIYAGTSVIFTATPTNGGTTPIYQWKLNGTLVGTNNSTYTYTPIDNDIVTCVLNSNASPCAIGSPANSNAVVMTVYSNKWKGTSGTNWNTGGNWLGGYVPSSGSDIEFDSNAINDLYLDQDRTIGNLINNSGKRLVIPPAHCLTVNDSILSNDVTGDKIYIQSSSSAANGSLIFHNKTTKVYGTVEMYSKAYYDPDGPTGSKYKWQYFGIPVHSVVANPVFAGSYVRQYNEPGTKGNTWIPLTNSSILSPLNGYEITQTMPETYTIQGELENVDLTRSLTNTSGAFYPGLHILSNPYTAAIDITQLNFTNMQASVYLFNTGSSSDWQANSGSTGPGNNPGQYIVVPQYAVGAPGIPSQIPSMQGFMVQVNSGGGILKIPYSSVVTKNTEMQRVSSFNQIEQKERVCTVIEVKGTRYSDIMWIISDPACTHNFDNGWDGYKMFGSTLTPQIYAMESDGNYQVNSVDDINNTDIGFQAGEDDMYTLVFNHQNLSSRYKAVYLVDLLKNETIDISQNGSTYTFTTNSGVSSQKRFKIITSPDVCTKSQETDPSKLSDLSVYSSKQTIYIQNRTMQSGDLVLYDTLGRFVEKFPFEANKKTVISTKLLSGFYIAKACTTKRTFSINIVL